MTRQTELSKEIKFITTRLGLMIHAQEGEKVYELVEAIRKSAKVVRAKQRPADIKRKQKLIDAIDDKTAYSVIHAFSLFFQLVNMCEERARCRSILNRPNLRQSLHAVFSQLRKDNIPEERIQQCLEQMEVEPVLTAHPTESKRRTTLGHLMRLSESIDNPDEILETLWQTRETRFRKISPLEEVKNCLFYFDHTIHDAVADYMRLFETELKNAYPNLSVKRPFLKISSWVGGDRDGNPFVTPEVSLETCKMQHELAVRLVSAQLRHLVNELSHADLHQGPEDYSKHANKPYHPDEIIRRRVAKLWKLVVPGYTDEKYLIKELKDIRQQLLAQKATHAANGRITDVIHQLESCGLILAHLDFRDHSGKLVDNRDEILEDFKTIAKIQSIYGERAAHRFIISMTHSKQTVCDVFDCAYEVGVKNIDIIPLFETIDDLNCSSELLSELLEDKKYRKHLKTRGDIQEIMLGYSDSCKDGGYLAANWYLHQAQRKLSNVADKYKIHLRLFHGKGGTIDRGGGMSYRSLVSQPHATPGARIRTTEQGEVISLKYANPIIARRNLEQLTTGLLDAFCREKKNDFIDAEWEAMMEQLANASKLAYRDLVYETEDFEKYLWSATPIDVVAELRIGSRPSSRSTTRETENLRAIPWVFSWTQSRHLLSAWFGIGSGLQSLMDSGVSVKKLQKMYKSWPYFSMLLDNAEISLAKTDLYIASSYASLVEDKQVRDHIFGRISDEYEKTIKNVLIITGHDELLAGSPRLMDSIRSRNPYIDSLHYMQVKLLKEWRSQPPNARSEHTRQLLALTVNGIAFGMKATG